MKEKLIDVIITTYNRNDTLIETLSILSNQTIKNFNLIINDDGSKDIINLNNYEIITKYIWNKDDGYHRVARFNESISMCVSPNIILLDDDCVPQSEYFLESYINLLSEYDVVRGLKFFPNGDGLGGWFSTTNLGITKNVYDSIGLFDINFDGNYGHEDIDLGIRIQNKNFKMCIGNENTKVIHGYEMYADGDRSENIIGPNTKYFVDKWGKDPNECLF